MNHFASHFYAYIESFIESESGKQMTDELISEEINNEQFFNQLYATMLNYAPFGLSFEKDDDNTLRLESLEDQYWYIAPKNEKQAPQMHLIQLLDSNQISRKKSPIDILAGYIISVVVEFYLASKEVYNHTLDNENEQVEKLQQKLRNNELSTDAIKKQLSAILEPAMDRMYNYVAGCLKYSTENGDDFFEDLFVNSVNTLAHEYFGEDKMENANQCYEYLVKNSHFYIAQMFGLEPDKKINEEEFNTIKSICNSNFLVPSHTMIST